MKRYGWGIVYGVLLTLFTVYVLLDTFVIARVYTTVPRENVGRTEGEESPERENLPELSSGKADDGEHLGENWTEDAGESTAEDWEEDETELQETEQREPVQMTPVITENSYEDGLISIVLTEHREYDTDIYVAEVKLSSPEYLKTALAKGVYGRNVTEKTSEMAKDNNAIFAVNGDYYGAQQKGYVLRNGVLYRDTADKNQEDLVIYEDGYFEIITEAEVTAEELLEKGAQQILSFGPGLLIDGEIAVSKNDEVGVASASNPRTAIGMIDELHYVFVVSDGRTKASAGLSLYEMAQFMQSLGVETAYNLDGGGSSSMVFNGKVINNPTTNGRQIKERSVSDIVYIGY